MIKYLKSLFNRNDTKVNTKNLEDEIKENEQTILDLNYLNSKNKQANDKLNSLVNEAEQHRYKLIDRIESLEKTLEKKKRALIESDTARLKLKKENELFNVVIDGVGLSETLTEIFTDIDNVTISLCELSSKLKKHIK